MVTVVLVDDDDGFRRLARLVLSADGVDVVADASDGRSALEAIARWSPDVVLLDIGLPGTDGIEIARRLSHDGDRAKVILISSRDSAYGNRVAAGVAAGFIRKDRLSLAEIEGIASASP